MSTRDGRGTSAFAQIRSRIGLLIAEAKSKVLVTDIAFSVIMAGIGNDRRMNR